MTRKEFLTAIINGELNEEIIETAQGILNKMEETALKNKDKPTKSYLENAPLREKVLEFLQTKNESTAKEVAELLDVKPSKATSVLRQMVNDESIERIDVGRNKPLVYKIKA